MYRGWFAYDGVPVVNAAMTRKIAQDQGLSWYTDQEVCGTQGLSTDVVHAPWYDVMFPESRRFAGFVLTDVTPFLNSYVTREVVELARGGAALGRRDERQRVIVMKGVLVAADRRAAVFGMEWLTNLLQFGGVCGESARDRTGFDMEVWLWCPGQREGDQQHRRFLTDVHVTEGPTILRELDVATCNGHVMEVEFTLTAGNPGIYGYGFEFGALVTGQIKDTYDDLLTLGKENTVVPQRTYAQVRTMVHAQTTYSEVLAALVTYGSNITVDPPKPWEA